MVAKTTRPGNHQYDFPASIFSLDHDKGRDVENLEVLKIKVRAPNTPPACCGDMDERVLFLTLFDRPCYIVSYET